VSQHERPPGVLSYAYSLKRESRNWYTSRENYLADRSGIAQPGESPSFCHGIETAAVIDEHGGGASRRLTAQSVHTWSPAQRWKNFPWITPVIGSGCLELRDQYDFTAESVARGVEAALIEIYGEELPGPGEHPASTASGYARNLVAARLPRAGARTGPSGEALKGEPLKVPELAARLVLLSARLTSFYHWVNAGSRAAMNRWDDDIARYSSDSGSWPPELQDIDQLVIRPFEEERRRTVSLIDRIIAERAGPRDVPVYRGIRTLLQTIGENLIADQGAQFHEVSRGHVVMLTEIAWFLLARDSTVYPGWTESLLRLILQQNPDSMRPQRRMSPLLADLSGTPQAINALMEPATEASWVRLHDETEPFSERNRLYANTARLLFAQQDAAEVWRRKSPQAKGLPTPSAYITSFDLELEMAMWSEGCRRRRTDEKSRSGFSVLVPVHIVAEWGSDAQFCWLRADIEPSTTEHDLTALRRPRNFRVPRTDEPTDVPVIVHLNGAPLLELPEWVDEVEGLAEDLQRLEVLPLPSAEESHEGLDRAPSKEENGTSSTRFNIVHAVTVDEYLARRQSERELTWLGMTNKAEHSHFAQRVLPAQLQADGLNRRFWMVLGVPIADPAVRTRVMAHLSPRPQDLSRKERLNKGESLAGGARESPPTGAREPTDSDGAPAEPARTTAVEPSTSSKGPAIGVAVNRRIDNDEASLMYWLGLDVIRTDVDDFIADLEHYTEHLSAPDAPAPSAFDKPCQLDQGAQ
jgi:hypothetical protein